MAIITKKTSFPPVFYLKDLNGANGFIINGTSTNNPHSVVSGIGDINGDGIDDVIIGIPMTYSSYTGRSYVVYGSQSGFPTSINLTSLNGTNGFSINGINSGDYSGNSVSGAGDINADGIDDLIIGAPYASNDAGQSYVIFGSQEFGFPAVIYLSALDGISGFAINGINQGDLSGNSVSEAGDINADGIDDFIIGAPQQPYGSGYSYVVYGSNNRFPAAFNLTSLDGTNGFTIHCISPYDYCGSPVSSAGDINADGINDLIIGARGVNYNAGRSYVVFGSQSGFPADFYLENLNGMNGFAINGINQGDSSGFSVSGTGDINADGINDLIISARGVNYNAGQNYVVFGSSNRFPADFYLENLNGMNGFAINGINQGDGIGFSVSGAGDINDDGIDDLIIGAPSVNGNTGQSYVVFGSQNGFPAAFNLTSLDGSNGFAINGIDLSDYSGWSVSGAGDINADGVDDIIIAGYGANTFAGESYVIFGQGQLVEESHIGTVIE